MTSKTDTPKLSFLQASSDDEKDAFPFSLGSNSGNVIRKLFASQNNEEEDTAPKTNKLTNLFAKEDSNKENVSPSPFSSPFKEKVSPFASITSSQEESRGEKRKVPASPTVETTPDKQDEDRAFKTPKERPAKKQKIDHPPSAPVVTSKPVASSTQKKALTWSLPGPQKTPTKSQPSPRVPTPFKAPPPSPKLSPQTPSPAPIAPESTPEKPHPMIESYNQSNTMANIEKGHLAAQTTGNNAATTMSELSESMKSKIDDMLKMQVMFAITNNKILRLDNPCLTDKVLAIRERLGDLRIE